MFREPADVVLAPDLQVIDVHIEHPTRSFDQLRADVEFLLDRFRQTGGGGEVVSLSAVFDTDVHA